MKMDTWRIIDSGLCDGAYNMALDESIAVAARTGAAPPTLRIYGWRKPSVTIGAFQKTADVDTDYCKDRDIPLVRRPTGGRAILHGDELTYSFSSPCEGVFARSLMETYLLLGAAFMAFFRLLGLDVEMQTQRQRGREQGRSALCFDTVSPGEIRCRGRKIAGAAQRRWSDGFLQQGAIPYRTDPAALHAVFTRPGSSEDQGLPAISAVPHVPTGLRELVRNLDSLNIKELLIVSFERTFPVTLEETPPSPREEELALRLCLEKYQDPQWLQGPELRSPS